MDDQLTAARDEHDPVESFVSNLWDTALVLLSIPVSIVREIVRAIFGAVFQMIFAIAFCAAVIWCIVGVGPLLYEWVATLPWGNLASLLHSVTTR